MQSCEKPMKIIVVNFFQRFDYVSSSSVNYVKFSKHLRVKTALFDANVFIDLVQSVPEKPTLSMTGLLNSSWKHLPRSRYRDLKKVSKITSTSKSPIRLPNQAHRNGRNAGARKDCKFFE